MREEEGRTMTGDAEVLSLIAEAARSGAEELEITGRLVEALPAEIGGLHYLKRLTVRDCGLKSLPPEIGNLRKLDRLELPSNELAAVPPRDRET
jgi:Leucine-rich repeat (LRR) protein